MATPSGAADLANQLLVTLVGDKQFQVPTVDISDGIFLQPPVQPPLSLVPPEAPTNDQLVALFGQLMGAFKEVASEEWERDRITGTEYSKLWLGAMSAAMQTATQFLLGKEQSRFQALLAYVQVQTAQIESVKARVELETVRVQYALAKFQALGAETAYATAKIQLSTADVAYSNAVLQGDLLGLQKEAARIDIDTKSFTYFNILPNQSKLVFEQANAARAQTADTRFDDTVVFGSVGKQKDLYNQQIISYQRDAENKFAKMINDAWVTQKTIDEGLLPPDIFKNLSLDAVFAQLRSRLGLT